MSSFHGHPRRQTAWCGRSPDRRASLGIVATTSIFGALVALAGGAHYAKAVETRSAVPADRLELVVLEAPGCGYCRQWHQEVGTGYRLSDEGKRAPLKRIDMATAEADQFARVVYTPTFVLVHNGEEIGRITGYSGADFFWASLSDKLRELDQGDEKRSAVEPFDPFNPYEGCD